MVDLALVNYLKRHLQKGYTKDELTKILTKNGWSKKELSEAFKLAESNKKLISHQISKQPKTNTQQTRNEKIQAQILILKNFILKSRERGIKDETIRNALTAKRWPANLIEEGFKAAGPAQQTKQKPIEQKKEEKPKKPFNWKMLLWYLLAFIVVSAIITGTIFVYYYVTGLSEYKVIINGTEYHGRCLNTGCSDMKDYALNYAKENLQQMILIGAGSAFLIVALYAITQIRNVILWVVNIAYFLFLIFIGVRWVLFTKSIS